MTIAAQPTLEAEIEALRGQFPKTQDLYREVCVILFFRHGITPTANKLHQLVRKGSMSAPAEALTKFWSDLREKSRGRVEHPDLPEHLKLAAGDLVAQLWQKAQVAAEDSLAVFRADAGAKIVAAEDARIAAEAARDVSYKDSEKLGTSLARADERVREFEQRLASEVASRTKVQEQLVTAQQTIACLNSALEGARSDFADELEKVREAMKLADDRSQAVHNRALHEIDRERGIASKVQKELDLIRTDAKSAVERHRQDSRVLQEEIGALRQHLGSVEGELRAVAAARDSLVTELAAERQSAQALTTHLGAASRETEVWRQKALNAAEHAEQLRKLRGRKSRADSDQLKLSGSGDRCTDVFAS